MIRISRLKAFREIFIPVWLWKMGDVLQVGKEKGLSRLVKHTKRSETRSKNVVLGGERAKSHWITERI